MTTENLHKNNMAKVFEQIRKRGENIEQPKLVLKQENKVNLALQPNMDAKIISSGSPKNAPKTSQALAAQQKFQAVVDTKSQKTSDSKLNTYELQVTKVLKTLTPEQKEKAGFAFTKANKTSAPQADNKAKLPEAKIWSSTPIKSPQDKHFHSPQKSNDSGISFDTNNSTEVNTTLNATDNLSKTFGAVQKDLMEKHNISVNPVKKKPSPVKDKIVFFNNLSRTSDSQESSSQIGWASRFILHMDTKNQPTPSAPPSPSTMDANKSLLVHMDTKNQPTPSAPPSPSTKDANKSSVGQNDAKKTPAKIIIGPREKRLMDGLKISNDVRKDNKIKKLIELFEPRKDAKLSNVNVKAVSDPSKVKQ